MKLWEKNYVLTMVLIMFVLFGSTSFVLQYSFRTDLKRYCDNSVLTEARLKYTMSNLINGEGKYQKLSIYCQSLGEQNIYVSIQSAGEEILDLLPFSMENPGKQKLVIRENGGAKYIVISDFFEALDSEEISLIYAEDVSVFYENYRNQTRLFLAVNLCLSLSLACFLYYVMRKLYDPVNNIAHELRTPLTSIQGYAQYIMLGNIGEEDVIYATDQINREARYINALIERILIMGNLRDGKIHMEAFSMEDVLREVAEHYPKMIIENEIETLYGDRALIECLLLNLLSNTSRQGADLSIRAKGKEICIFNRADRLEPETLKLLNGNGKIPEKLIHGKGLGVNLCRDIVKVHRGKLTYENAEGGGVRITLRFL